jgi:hypothetical protein
MLQELVRSEEKQAFVNADGENLKAELQVIDAKDFSGSRWGKKRELSWGWLIGLYCSAGLL